MMGGCIFATEIKVQNGKITIVEAMPARWEFRYFDS